MYWILISPCFVSLTKFTFKINTVFLCYQNNSPKYKCDSLSFLNQFPCDHWESFLWQQEGITTTIPESH